MVSVELQNTSTTPLCVKSNFSPSAGYELLDMPADNSDVWQDAMAIEEVRKSLFRLIPNKGTQQAPSRGVGRLEITWSGRMGECGRLESTDIQHRSSDTALIEMTHLHIPNTVKIHSSFALHATLVNISPDKAPLSPYLILEADKLHPLSFTGPSRYFMETIDYGKSLNVQITLVALTAGVHVCYVCLFEMCPREAYFQASFRLIQQRCSKPNSNGTFPFLFLVDVCRRVIFIFQLFVFFHKSQLSLKTDFILSTKQKASLVWLKEGDSHFFRTFPAPSFSHTILPHRNTTPPSHPQEVTGIEMVDAHTGKPLMAPLSGIHIQALR